MKTQKLFLSLLLSFLIYFPGSLPAQGPLLPTGNDGKIKWYTYEEAYNLNKKHPKKMMIDVFTEWCGWCRKMDAETFTNPTIVKYMNAHFYCVKFDAERKDTIRLDGVTYVNPNPAGKRSTHQLANELLRNHMSYPSYVFLTDKGKSISVVPGYHQAKEFEAIISWFGEDAYLTTKFDEFSAKFKGELK